MTTRLIAIAAVSIALAACTQQATRTEGYLYPQYWGSSPADAASPGQGPVAIKPVDSHSIPGSVAIFGSHASPASGVWLFPPDPYQ